MAAFLRSMTRRSLKYFTYVRTMSEPAASRVTMQVTYPTTRTILLQLLIFRSASALGNLSAFWICLAIHHAMTV